MSVPYVCYVCLQNYCLMLKKLEHMHVCSEFLLQLQHCELCLELMNQQDAPRPFEAKVHQRSCDRRFAPVAQYRKHCLLRFEGKASPCLLACC